MERLIGMVDMLRRRRAVSTAEFIDALEVSRATVKRDIEYLRDRLRAPIRWDRDLTGYVLDDSDANRWELPGLWFNASEAHALLTMAQLLSHLEPGLLSAHLAPLRQRIHQWLGGDSYTAEAVGKRIRVLHLATRSVQTDGFAHLATAVLTRKRLEMTHLNRGSGERKRREVSPQRLVHYRDNWYLDAWCHLRQGLRSFGVDAISDIRLLDTPAIDMDEQKLDRELGAGYGIFAGATTEQAVLRFSEHSAQWVSREQWHPDQQGEFDEQGRYVLRLPYAHDFELIMDILRYGPDVEVLAPTGLRRRVAEVLREALAKYQD